MSAGRAVAQHLTLSALALLTCLAAPRRWGVGGATLLLGGLVNGAFSAALFALGAGRG